MEPISYLFRALVCSSIVLVAACSTANNEPSEAYKGETAEQIFIKGETALREHRYAEAIKRYEALDIQYPFASHAEMVQLHIIYAYYKNNDYLSAEAAADRFIHSYPASQYVDYAYFMRGLSNYYQNMGVFERLFTVDFSTRDLTQIKKSFNDFAEIVNHFPESPYAPAAHQYMIYLRNVLANHQLEVAKYYFDRKAYVAAVNRAGIVVRHYQGAPGVPAALVIMAKSYYQLKQPTFENQMESIIQYNYPNSIYSQEVSPKNISNPTLNIPLN